MATLLSTPLWVQPTSKSIHKYRTRIHASSQSSLLFETSVAATEQTTTSQSQTLDFSPGIMDIPWIHWISPNCQPTKPRPNSIEKIREGYASLRRRQMEAETEAWDEALEEYKELERKMLDKKLAPSLPYVKSLCLSWFEQLKDAIEQDKEDQKKKQSKNSHAIYMGLLPADKLAVILMTKVMEMLMPRKSDSVPLTQVALRVGEAIEQEYKIQTFMEKARKSNKNRNEEEELEEISSLEMKIAGKPARHVSGIKKLLRMKKIEIESWPKPAQVQLACRLIEILIETAYVPVPQAESSERLFEMRPAFRHNQLQAAHYEGKFKYRHGVLECDPLIYEHFDSSSVRHMMIPYLPMLVHPLTWKGYNEGAYFYLPSYFMRTHGSKDQREMLRRTPKKQLEKVFEALDALGSTKWRINRRILDIVDNLWDNGGGIAGLVTRQDVSLPEKPKTDDEAEIKKWRWLRRKARKANSEMHALRCDTEIILSVARKMKEEEGFYYPHNLDFRGRAYPMHSHLIHLGSDLCRGILEFCEGKPLGKSGLRWLKIHLANVYGGGIEKLSYDMRLNFAELHLKEIFDSASDPIHGERWWMKGEDPFQCLATCIELAGALKSVFPHTYVSHIPIHQDGSCNGLQHYSALGKFAPEARAVNLVAGDKPADVYTGVALRVMEKMKEDSKRDPEKFSSASLAKILVNEVDRKLVKQTVMTSVYGVTFIGARAQIKKRLQEKGFVDDDRLLFKASCYASKVTLEALGEMFQAARAIMSWLAECAKIISSVNEPVKWTTPLGLPVVQPYRNQKSVNIVTSLQQMSLKKDGDKVSARQQRQAFPPNFVHSLDGSHMMLTATACRRQGLTFAGVHDSFWTHACDVDTMNRILREKFVELYNIPILENLLESFETSFPELVFPPLPETGDFDIRQVLNSPYFFN